MLKLIDIKKDYKVADSYVHALKGVSLSFRENEFVCILGQSGCGKTTLLNIIGGLDHYTSGDLVIEGKSTKDFKDRDWDVYRNHRIGFIFQSYNLIPHQTVLGNVEIALTIAGVSREERRERAKRALERVGLGEELHKKPNQLSGGQCQRVAIARALVNNPDILLADEPTGALDSETSVQIMELIKEIAGERLVVMVTHNPELAEKYATRIVRLKDGQVESDSNPYAGEEDSAVEDAAERSALPEETKTSETKGRRTRTRMDGLTTLSLSARNLLTKKGRTILTSVGGSIGIISVCLVLALSSGFNSYIRRTEEDMLSYYPIQIKESAFDMSSAMTSFMAGSDLPDMSRLEDKIYVDSFLTSLGQGMAVQNNVSENYISYVSRMDPEWYSAIQYSYGASITENLFTDLDIGGVEIQGETVEATTVHYSLSQLKSYYIAELEQYKPEYSALIPFADFFGGIVSRMPGTKDFSDGNFGAYVRSQYDVVSGTFPTNANEAVYVIDSSGASTDLTLAQLGLLNEQDFLALFDKGQEGEETPMYVGFDEIVNKQYILYYNDAVYRENTPSAEDPYPFSYTGDKTGEITRENGEVVLEDGAGIRITVTGVLRLKEGLTYGCLSEGLNLTEATVDEYIQANMQSKIVGYMNRNSKDVTINGQTYSIYLTVPSKNLAGYYDSSFTVNGVPVPCVYGKSALRHVGGEDSYNAIAIYATDFDGKDAILAYLDEWNKACETGGMIGGVELTDADKIVYTDTVGTLMGIMQTMLDVITYVLVAFTAISLVVSSVMIGIITYVSVVERVKEIGVLRSLGARKRDIKNLFNAETFIIGLGAGLFGVAVTYVLSIFINLILQSLTGIAGIAALSPVAALVMVCVSVCLTLISGLIPASAAAKKDPVIALRTE